MVVARKETQEKVRGDLGDVVQQLGKGSQLKDSRIKSIPVQAYSTLSCATQQSTRTPAFLF